MMNTEKVRYALGRIAGIAEELAEELEKIKPAVKVGQYWKSNNTNTVYRVFKTKTLIGFQNISDESDRKRWSESVFRENFRLLSDSEVEQALIEEAERRGLVKDKKVKRSWDTNSFEDLPVVTLDKSHLSDGYRYKPQKEILLLEGWEVYKQGQWAKIISEEWEVVDNKMIYEVTNGSIHLGIPEAMNEEQAEAIADALNDLED